MNEAVAAFHASTVQKFPLSFSVGIAELTTGGRESLEDLVATADARMYENKARKKSRPLSPAASINPPVSGAVPVSAGATNNLASKTSVDSKVGQSA